LVDEKAGCACLADVAWNGVNLALVKWSEVKMLGDEYKARQKNRDGKVKEEYSQSHFSNLEILSSG
jgi:hypothetical protein